MLQPPNLPLSQLVLLPTNQHLFHPVPASQDFSYPLLCTAGLTSWCSTLIFRSRPQWCQTLFPLPVQTLLPTSSSMYTEILILPHYTDTKKRPFPS